MLFPVSLCTDYCWDWKTLLVWAWMGAKNLDIRQPLYNTGPKTGFDFQSRYWNLLLNGVSLRKSTLFFNFDFRLPIKTCSCILTSISAERVIGIRERTFCARRLFVCYKRR